MRPGETLSLTVTLPRGQEFAVENLLMEPHTLARLQHYKKRLVQNPKETV